MLCYVVVPLQAERQALDVDALSVVLSCIMLCGCVTAGRKALYAEALNAFKE